MHLIGLIKYTQVLNKRNISYKKWKWILEFYLYNISLNSFSSLMKITQMIVLEEYYFLKSWNPLPIGELSDIKVVKLMLIVEARIHKLAVNVMYRFEIQLFEHEFQS